MSESENYTRSAPRVISTAAGLSAIVVAGCIVSWLLLRQPALRQGLLTLVPHRSLIAQAVERQLLAPRSILTAGLIVMMLAACGALVERLKTPLVAEIQRDRRWVALFVLAQVGLAFAPVVNLHFYYLRHYGKPIGLVSKDDILTYTIPQAWPDSKKLKAMLPPGTRIALKVEDNDVYQLAGLGYPLWFYDVYPASEHDWKSDDAFKKIVDDHKIDALLRYSPRNRSNPFQLEMIK